MTGLNSVVCSLHQVNYFLQSEDILLKAGVSNGLKKKLKTNKETTLNMKKINKNKNEQLHFLHTLIEWKTKKPNYMQMLREPRK